MSAMTYPVEVAPRVVSRVSPRRADAPSMRLTARGRAVLIALVLLVAAAWTFHGSGAHAGTAPAAVTVSAVTVAPGQTLWQIASTITEPGEDVRDVVDELIALNGLAGADLQAGQQLLVPQD
ncbi:LysM peptidoglycan-binding domain-containing protein [Actinotalea sp. M2MS4P-6]|uniref:LysM peptidoglycan-binding domain-containing protein n=1 Tax=Actinotalea sp. M2MS4P-6 TaxID=2983762 RepID=UPI0021E4AFE8|nr:LysM peptidoglycan-binding domain-containing protein [Actinotalea sp. M2MS4P-6]MCV2393446.1 LysM peptidoglycan-binding domain-containing protein [Actinotalea sp. M2MS4P-6]